MKDVVKTKKGTELPLTNLKGKAYLMVAYRLQWFNEEEDNFTIKTDLLKVDDEQTIAKAEVIVMDKDGKVKKSATATKRETKKDFSDHTEKAETSAVGRALAMLGYGTQFALSDLDEGNRLADSPLSDVKTEAPKVKRASFAKGTIIASGSASASTSNGDNTVTTKVVQSTPTVPNASGWE